MDYAVRLKNQNTGDSLQTIPYIPVNFIHFGVSPEDLEYMLGGTWQLYAKGRSLVGHDPSNSIGVNWFNTLRK